MIKFLVVVIASFLFFSQEPEQSYPETLRIGLYSGYEINGFNFSAIKGEYHIEDGCGNLIKEVKTHDYVIVKNAKNGLKIKSNNDTLKISDKIYFYGKSFKNTFLINPLDDSINYRMYDGDIIAKNNSSKLNIINLVPFENYIAGVVQSESGFGKHPEYYKLQATVSRTYTIKNLERHKNEGYHLCDQVHCQAYYSKSIYPEIIFSTEYTRGDIIVDKQGTPINSVFHANCGGYTINSEYLWQNSSSYLKSIKDSFCIEKPGADWEKSIPKKEFTKYLQNKLGSNYSDSIAEELYNFEQKQRQIYLDPYKIIHLGQFRNDFMLRSTFFNIEPKGDSLHLTGRGYGHGVGLCQEGAMRMAEKGISRDSIIRFYYKNADLNIND